MGVVCPKVGVASKISRMLHVQDCTITPILEILDPPLGSMQIPLENTKTVQELPDSSFCVLMMQYIQRCRKERVWVRDYLH